LTGAHDEAHHTLPSQVLQFAELIAGQACARILRMPFLKLRDRQLTGGDLQWNGTAGVDRPTASKATVSPVECIVDRCAGSGGMAGRQQQDGHDLRAGVQD
jgi:hypothetical protein